MHRPDWPEYFLRIARTVASRSTCLRIPDGLGAVLVRDNRVLSTGYAGSVRGQPHCEDEGVGCLLDSRTLGCVRTVHAEQNAILQAAQHGVSIKGATCYSTMSPCWDCMKALVNGGVVSVVYEVEYRDVARQRELAAAAGVGFEQVGSAKYEPGVKS